MGPQRLLRIVLPATSLVVIGLGGALLYSGSEVGWFLIAFGAIDLVTMPFVLRMMSQRSGSAGRSPTDPADPPEVGTEPIDPTADPSYNPYARED